MLLYDFYYKELRTYINSSECVIKYWKKYRAKAKLAMVIEKYENHHIRYIPILISDGNNSISKSVQSFSKEYSVTTPICIPVPNADKVIDGWELHEKICNNT